MTPTVSIVISVHQDERISRCLESLCNQNYAKKNYEVLVIENGGAPKFKEICNKLKAKYFYLSEKNMAHARSMGVLKSKGKYVLFTDSDCIADKNWIKNIVAFLQRNKAYGVGGRIKRYNPQTIAEKYAENLASGQNKLQSYLPIIDLPYVVLANAGFERKALIKVGLFDNILLSGNDVDICWKLILNGYKLGVCNSAIIYHENRKSTKSCFKAHFRYATYQILLFNKYKSEINKYKQKIHKLYLINTYPFFLVKKSIFQLIKELLKKAMRKQNNIYPPYFLLIEASGIICGIAYGCIKFRKIPIY